MQFQGYIPIDSTMVFFECSDSKLTLYAPKYDDVSTVSKKLTNRQDIMAFRIDGTPILLHLALPLDMQYMEYFLLSSRLLCEVEWYIEDYCKDIAYHGMNLSFAEFDYFFPSAGMAKFKDKSISIQTKPENSWIGKINILGKECEIRFSNTYVGSFSAFASIRTSSMLRVSFEPTDDISFLLSIYDMLHRAFSFICNRRNIYPKIKLSGENIHKEETEESVSPITSSLVPLSRFPEWREEETVLKKTPHFNIYEEHLETFLQLFADDYTECSAETKIDDKGYVSIDSMHDSDFHRYHILSSQCLHITADFEFYVRKHLPSIGHNLNEDEKELLDILQNFIDNHTGQVKKTAKGLRKSLQNSIPLPQKIQNAYNGYKNEQGQEWKSIKGILGKFYGEDISSLAEEVKDWRNDFAHGKRTYTPSDKTVRSVRMMELMNYCIVLRKVGYSDEQISAILKATFPDETKRYEVDG